MTGSIQEKRGYYHTVICTRGEDGKPHYKWQTTGLPVKGNRRKAERILQERMAEQRERAHVIQKDVEFSAFMLEWLEIIRTQVRPNTFHEYELIVKNSVVPYFKKQQIALQDLQPMHIQRYYNKKLKGGVTGNTVKHHHANIRKALQYALKQNWIPYNPADRVELPKVEVFTGNFYTAAEIKQVFELVKDTVLETPVLLTATYGLRRSEALGLKWDAIDFEHHTITIRHTVVGNGRRTLQADHTKNRSSTRTLHLTTSVEEHLKKVLVHQEEMQGFVGKGYDKGGYVCTWDDGSLIKPDYLSQRFKKIISKSSLPVYRYHDLRHSSASLLIANGCTLKEVAEWLGHSSISTTNRYAHLQHQATIKMANSVEQSLFEAG
ncbi:site-specific integrase [Ruminococcaceae bacterium OttesenSCG-928-D13]|nr:site-specific integrase [Ruminococcaceae bacterium OttesenSCG-928-D13]